MEVLICLFILSILLTGLEVTQIIALRETKAGFYFVVEAQQKQVMTERNRGNC